ncbi:MAG: hypothetical protein K1000chlam3_01805, partial [Chlamydiae bacterium]|nr:hypothetical protein [Chlamydiota bacterium]
NSAKLDEKDEHKVLIKKLVFLNIRTDLLFRQNGKGVRRLPTIARIELTNISTEGGLPMDQLASSILGQMLKQVFIQQNVNNMLKGILKTPSNAIDTFLKPFKGIFNANFDDEVENELLASA